MNGQDVEAVDAMEYKHAFLDQPLPRNDMQINQTLHRQGN